MNNLEQRIRAAKTVEPPLEEGFAAEVWEAIQARGLTIRPRWQVLALRMLRRVAAVLLLVGGLWAANTAFYETRANGNLELLYFGMDFLATFMTQLPFDLIFAMAALAALGAWLLREGKLARVRMAWIVLITYGITGVGGLAGANSGINEVLIPPMAPEAASETSEAGDDTVLGYFRRRMHYRHPHPNVRMGRIVEREDGVLVMETPLGERMRIPFRGADEKAFPRGMHLRLRGRATPKGFLPDEVQRCDPSRVGRYFHRMRGMGGRGPGMGGHGPGMGGAGPGMHPMGKGPMGKGPVGRGPMGGGPVGRGPMMR